MALYELSLKSNVVDVTILEPNSGSTQARIAILMSTDIAIYSWDIKGKPAQRPILLASQTISGLKNIEFPIYSDCVNQQIAFSDNGSIQLLQSCEAGSIVRTYSFQDESLILIKSTSYSPIMGMIRSVSTIDRVPYLFLSSGEVVLDPTITASLAENEIPSKTVLASFPLSTYKVEVVDIANHNLVSSELFVDKPSVPGRTHIAFGLTSNGALFANERCLTKDCTSFLLTSSHLIYTSIQHLLKFVHLAPVFSE